MFIGAKQKQNRKEYFWTSTNSNYSQKINRSLFPSRKNSETQYEKHDGCLIVSYWSKIVLEEVSCSESHAVLCEIRLGTVKVGCLKK